MRTLEEIERHAFVSGDERTVAIIHQGEEEFQGETTFEHQLVIDDRNRMSDALQAIVSAWYGGVLKDDLIEAAQKALDETEEQGEVTLRALCDSQAEKLSELNKELNVARHENAKLRRIRDRAKFLLRAFIGKHHPAWAQSLRDCIKENT